MARKQWRCFFCDEVFTRQQDAAKHFGVDDSCEADVPACKLTAHEGHLVDYIRKLENEVRRYQAEDSDVMRSIQALEADHRQALIRAEEEGYNRGVQDMKANGCSAEKAAEHQLVGGALVNEGNGRGITARCTCGWVSGGHFPSAAASAIFIDHQESEAIAREKIERNIESGMDR